MTVLPSGRIKSGEELNRFFWGDEGTVAVTDTHTGISYGPFHEARVARLWAQDAFGQFARHIRFNHAAFVRCEPPFDTQPASD